jgi:hypothetical protein
MIFFRTFGQMLGACNKIPILESLIYFSEQRFDYFKLFFSRIVGI